MAEQKKYAILDTDFVSKANIIKTESHVLADEVLAFSGYSFFCHQKMKEELADHGRRDAQVWLENKIKSGIIGIKAKLSEDDDPELCEVDITKKVVVDKSTRKIISQLSKYYEIAKKDYGYDDNKIFCFVLRPEYVGKLNLDDYLNGEQYTQISYEKLHKFFNNVLQEIHKQKKQGKSVFIEDEDICYLNQFCKALHKHTKAVDDEFRTDMLIRMKARIDEINKAKPTSAVQPVLPNNN